MPEKKDYIDVTEKKNKTVTQRFKQALDAVQQEYTAKHLPFDYYNAKRDFQDDIDALERKAERLGENADEIEIPAFNFDKYGKPERFELIATTEEYSTILLDGVKQKVLSEYCEEFRVKEIGNRISVFVPVNVYNERNNKKTSTKG